MENEIENARYGFSAYKNYLAGFSFLIDSSYQDYPSILASLRNIRLQRGSDANKIRSLLFNEVKWCQVYFSKAKMVSIIKWCQVYLVASTEVALPENKIDLTPLSPLSLLNWVGKEKIVNIND